MGVCDLFIKWTPDVYGRVRQTGYRGMQLASRQLLNLEPSASNYESAFMIVESGFKCQPRSNPSSKAQALCVWNLCCVCPTKPHSTPRQSPGRRGCTIDPAKRGSKLAPRKIDLDQLGSESATLEASELAQQMRGSGLMAVGKFLNHR